MSATEVQALLDEYVAALRTEANAECTDGQMAADGAEHRADHRDDEPGKGNVSYKIDPATGMLFWCDFKRRENSGMWRPDDAPALTAEQIAALKKEALARRVNKSVYAEIFARQTVARAKNRRPPKNAAYIVSRECRPK